MKTYWFYQHKNSKIIYKIVYGYTYIYSNIKHYELKNLLTKRIIYRKLKTLERDYYPLKLISKLKKENKNGNNN